MDILRCAIGTRVKVIKYVQPPVENILGHTGTIKAFMEANITALDGSTIFTILLPAVEFDQPFVGAHDCNGRCARNRGYWCGEETLEKIDE